MISIPGWKKSYTRDVPEFTKDEAALKADTREKMGQILHGAYQNSIYDPGVGKIVQHHNCQDKDRAVASKFSVLLSRVQGKGVFQNM